MATEQAPPIARPAAEARTVADLVALARNGVLRIPPFQRRFRWESRDIERLFDSIWRGYPVGSLLLWRHSAPAVHTSFGPVEVDGPAQTDALFVVDGQQRLTSLVGVLAAPDDVSGAFALYFDLDQKVFRRTGRRIPPADWLPLRKVIDTNHLLDWLLDFRERGGAESDVEVATDLARRVREYQIPVSIVDTEAESVLRDIFDRLNNFGRGLTRAEVFQALHAAIGEEEPSDLRGLVDDVAGFGFGPIRDDTVLRSVLALRGGDVFRDFRDEFGPDEDPADAYRNTADALRRAIRFLQQDAGIPHVRTLPYLLVVPVLARFFHLHPDPSERSRVLLRRWVWRGAVAEVGGGGGATATLRRSVQAVTHDEDGSVQALLGAVSHAPQAPIDLTATQLNRAAARANVALLSGLAPRDFESGQPLDLPALFDNPDADPLLMRLVGTSGRVDSLANLFIHPPVRDDEIQDALVPASEPVLQSHAITPDTVSLLRDGKIDEFLDARRASMEKALTDRRDAMTDRTQSDRPPLDALVVNDDATG